MDTLSCVFGFMIVVFVIWSLIAPKETYGAMLARHAMKDIDKP